MVKFSNDTASSLTLHFQEINPDTCPDFLILIYSWFDKTFEKLYSFCCILVKFSFLGVRIEQDTTEQKKTKHLRQKVDLRLFAIDLATVDSVNRVPRQCHLN